MYETKISSPSANNDKRSTDTPVEKTGSQILMEVLKTYSLILLKNAIQNEETNTDHSSGTIFPSITSHDHILSKAKGDINRKWV